MLRTITLAIVLTVLLIPGVARAQGADPGAARTSINCEDASFRIAIRTLLRNAGLRYQIAGELPDARVTLKLSQVPVGDALKVLVRQAAFKNPHLRFTSSGGNYVVTSVDLDHPGGRVGAPLLPDAGPSAGLQEIKAVGTDGLSLRTALDRLFAAAGASVVFDPDVPDLAVAGAAAHGSLWERINGLVEAARTQAPELYIGRIGEVYVVARLSPLLPRPAPKRTPDGRQERLITVKLDGVPLRAAIGAVFAATGEQYSVFSDVPDIPISVEFHEVSVYTAFYGIFRLAKAQIPWLWVGKD